MKTPSGFDCKVCGEHHAMLPLAYGPTAPANFFAIPEDECESRVALSPDLCVIDRQEYYICGNLELPIVDCEDRFSWDVWVSLSRENFERSLDIWDEDGREEEPPMPGTLGNTLIGYPQTLNLRLLVHTRPKGIKPFLEVLPAEHPLFHEQQVGITLQRIQEFAELVLHQDS